MTRRRAPQSNNAEGPINPKIGGALSVIEKKETREV
ncbi:hypothetical protein PG2115B_1617 [Bifidobacterium pseudolongum subsp. globosum]|nr:hypothetical protein PG2115B_1617 [Bifidobacterium pseudolongum subsp. globosum]RYQ03948.1 hypothetical protein PG2114B_1621 [Bifidobacterium pseudolongum subsp. globosum]